AYLWHGQEMIFGAFGAALVGFVLSAMPEWTDTPPLSGRVLWLAAGAWAAARVVGLFGVDALLAPAAAADVLLFGGLAAYATRLAWLRPAARLASFAGWLWGFAVASAFVRIGFLQGDPVLASWALHAALLVFLGLLTLALARIVPVVLNLVLDPTQQTTPFRPHPGRRHLAAGMVAVALAGHLAGVSPAVQGFLLIGAGAAFLDRVGDAFVGRAFFRAEVLVLAGGAALSGVGLAMMGLGRLGLVEAGLAGLHVTTMGGLGLAVIGVFAVAGRLHTGQALRLPGLVVAAVLLVLAATALRAATAFGFDAAIGHGAASLLWAGGFLLWLVGYAPVFADPARRSNDGCG
ncbi:MAG: NnrS family protein, partial [Acetobacteraceae bacterium]|nr:NnrS family protein [Acetobacteraceae bacterium]